MQVSKWENSLAIRLPAAVVDALKLQEGDDIEVVIADARVLRIAKKPGREAGFFMQCPCVATLAAKRIAQWPNGDGPGIEWRDCGGAYHTYRTVPLPP